MTRILYLTAAAVALSGCMMDGLVGRSSPDAAFSATSTDELVSLGAVRLEDQAIIAQLSGITLVEPEQGWTWHIRADGTQAAQADDGTWADSNGSWEVADGKFCRQNEDIEQRCSEVYQLGQYYRFTLPDGSLDNWTVTQKRG
ncbi:MAG: hypothetical protein AAGF74_11035 [Pseudomonadota bacterium]